MAFEVSGSYRDVAKVILRSEFGLSEAQKDALRAELAQDPENRGYAGKTLSEQWELLLADYQVPNPDPQPLLDRTEWKPDVLKNVLLQMILPNGLSVWAQLELMRESTDIQQKAFAIQALATFTLEAINMQNPMVIQGFQTIAQAFGLTQEQQDYLTKYPDPNWPPYVWRESRASAVLGGGVIPTLSEMEAL